MRRAAMWLALAALGVTLGVTLAACGGGQAASGTVSSANQQAAAPPQAPPPAQLDGFDAAYAYDQVAKLVAFGPRPAGSDANHRQQQYIIAQLKSYGCPVEEDDFHAQTPIGDVAMKDIVVKIPGASPNIVMFASHYDTKTLANFVGADDGASSTAVMLELARLLCARKNQLTLWIAFFDGEEAFNWDWADPDNTYGSRELAAEMANSGDLAHLKAMVLADMIGIYNLQIKRESDSTPWLTDLVWSTAARLGYGNVFVNEKLEITDDHDPFLKRGAAACDVIDFEGASPIWHTVNDTLDKIDPRSLGITGHVFLESFFALEQKFQ
ncbi:MAG: M28 family peptidase [Candidatus Acidiferrales bacterium]